MQNCTRGDLLKVALDSVKGTNSEMINAHTMKSLFFILGSSKNSTELVITGTGFDDDVPGNNEVKIGGTACQVTSATFTEVRCEVGPGKAGIHRIVLNVTDKGHAKHESGIHSFTYEFEVDGIDPTAGGLGGTYPTTKSTEIHSIWRDHRSINCFHTHTIFRWYNINDHWNRFWT